MIELEPDTDALPRLDPMLVDPIVLLISAALAWPACHRVEKLAELTKIETKSVVGAIERLAAAGRARSRRDASEATWVWLTEVGRDHLIAHLRVLRALLEKADELLPNS